MKKKTNLFERVKQFHFHDEENETDLWVNEEDLPDFKLSNSHIPNDKLEKMLIGDRTISGKQFNEEVIGIAVDFGGPLCYVVDEECPTCKHLLLNHRDDKFPNARFCMMCDYVNEDLVLMDEYEASLFAVPGPDAFKIREVGQTVEEFIEKYHFSEFMKDVVCSACEQPITKVSDYYRTKDCAFIEYEHNNCENKPAQIRPLGEMEKKWKDHMNKF